MITLDDICTLVEGMTDDVATLQMVLGLLQVFIQNSVTKLTARASSDSAMVILLRCIELFYRHLKGNYLMLQFVREVLAQIQPSLDQFRSKSILIAGLADWLEAGLQQSAEESWLAQKIAACARSRGRSIRAGNRELLTDGDCLLVLDNAASRDEPVRIYWPDSFALEYRLAFRLTIKDHPTPGTNLIHTWTAARENWQTLETMFEPAFSRMTQGQPAPSRTIFQTS